MFLRPVKLVIDANIRRLEFVRRARKSLLNWKAFRKSSWPEMTPPIGFTSAGAPRKFGVGAAAGDQSLEGIAVELGDLLVARQFVLGHVNAAEHHARRTVAGRRWFAVPQLARRLELHEKLSAVPPDAAGLRIFIGSSSAAKMFRVGNNFLLAVGFKMRQF